MSRIAPIAEFFAGMNRSLNAEWKSVFRLVLVPTARRGIIVANGSGLHSS
jgi:hypothetical protein